MNQSYQETLPTSQTEGNTAIEVNNLNFYYGKAQVLKNISLRIPNQQVTAIIGSSGCGKSTFLKALNRIGELESKGDIKVQGEVKFFGQNIYDPKVNIYRLRRQVSMVFQKPNPFPKSIYDNVVYGLRLIGGYSKLDLDEIVESTLRRAALWEEVKDKLKQSALALSGGQQQRLCIARALAIEPKVLLMDEPCSALDPNSTMKIEELIHELRKQLTIVIVTHNLQQAHRVADYTAFFNIDEDLMGRLVEVNSTEKIFSEAEQQSTRDYVEGRFG
ncbi:MAG: phosphate ABC transporter ATP-binding protein PstB [Halothece sp.]